ncbi:MAG: SPOR domain-containing protein [Sulfurovum sp.]|nr:SPOR domain-containing protein [Sulfurovum sp.]MCB4763348.1 SPOR domain-containing protein [Sulfurovum sp.]
MNDHNLDDLIIDTHEKQNGKAKGFLTIVAIFIIVMIVAIILTKIILKKPNEDMVSATEIASEMISPELTLKNTPQENLKNNKEISNMTNNEAATQEEKEENTPIQQVSEETVLINEQKSKSIVKTIEKPVKSKEIIAIPEAKPMVKNKSKLPTSSQTIQEKFYIQTGSFSKVPSTNSHLLRIVKKRGYRYQIIHINNTHKVMIGPYESRSDADRAITKIKNLISKNAFIVKR